VAVSSDENERRRLEDRTAYIKENEELKVLQKRNLGYEGEQTGNEDETCSC
jgi:hypothetical protein